MKKFLRRLPLFLFLGALVAGLVYSFRPRPEKVDLAEVKRGPLTEAEFGQMRRHPAAGARMLETLGAPSTILPVVLHHHERWDGAGYPAGRRGEEIPLEARVLCIVDSFDAMTSTRPYRAPRRPDEAWDELQRCAGTQFDPELVEAFAEAWAESGLGVLVWQHAAAS